MNNNDLQTVYTAVAVSKLLYASSAWMGFTTAAGRLRVGETGAQWNRGYSETIEI